MAGRLLQTAGLFIGVAGLVLQFAISIPAAMAAGRNLGQSIVFYVSFFTILTNAAVVMVYATALLGDARSREAFLARQRVRNGVAVAVAAVFLVYIAVLEPIWQPQGWFLMADILLHYVAPILYLAWWLSFAADGSAKWRDIPWWMVYPAAYLVYILARAPLSGEVPYPFLDIPANGVTAVVFSAFLMLLLFLALGVVAVLADHGVSRFRRARNAGRGQTNREYR